LAHRGKRSRGFPRKKGARLVSYTLDQFSLDDLRHWQRKSRSIEEYHLRVYHELEAQRQLNRGELLKALKEAKRPSPLSLERWVRMVDYKYSSQPLSAAGSILGIGGRFNIGQDLRQSAPFHALYLAEDADTAFREYYGMAREERRTKLTPLDLALTPKKSFACVNVSGAATNLLDITDAKHLKKFCDAFANFRIDPKLRELLRGTSLPEMQIVRDPKVLLKTMLLQSWRELGMQLGIPSNSQVFGRMAFEAGYDGILYNSVRGDGRCLSVFLENLTHSETVLRLSDPPPSSETIAELNSDTWPRLVTPFSLAKAAARLFAVLH
jgi:hypothetical protein